MIKKTIIQKIEQIIKKTVLNKYKINPKKIMVDKTKNIVNGDFFTNAALLVSGMVKKPLEEVAQTLIKDLKKNELFKEIKLTNGFINFFLSDKEKFNILNYASKNQNEYGQFAPKKLWYNIEYVSANPTGSLHIGHARNAALGMTLNNVWQKYGIKVDTEYYINDAGSQINKLGLSVFVRYLQELGVSNAKMGDDWYQGDEPKQVAKQLVSEIGDKYKNVEYTLEEIKDNKVYEFFKNYSKKALLNLIKKDLKAFRTKFKRYYPESKIYELNIVPSTIKKLGKNVFEKDGATWLRTSDYGDDKDRVIVKSNKELTYFMPDIAYHNIKLSRGYDMIFNIFGADHTTYVTSMKAAVGCLGHNPNKLHVVIMQMVKLTKDGQEFKMSKRTGQSVTLRDLINTMGVESARWSLISQASDTHLEIDVNQFKDNSQDNHLFYVLYAYARISKILQKAKKEKINFSKSANKLNLDSERELINMVHYYPHTIENISKHYDTHKIPAFLYSLASSLNSYYNEVKILDLSNKELTSQRLLLIDAVRAVLGSGLKLMDIKPKNKL